MGIGKSLKSAYRKVTHNKIYDRSKLRKAIGLSSRNKLWRQLKRSISGGRAVSTGYSSAYDLASSPGYYTPKSISELMS